MDYLKDASIYQYKEGFLELMTGPGLGMEINEDFVKQAAKSNVNWKNPIWRNFDGTVAEW